MVWVHIKQLYDGVVNQAVNRSFLAVASCLSLQVLPAFASDCDDGVAYYKQHNYAAANASFKSCMRRTV
jgi:hypothetical protein